MTILGSAKQDRKIKTQALVIFEGKKDTVVYHGELLDTQTTSVHGDGNGLSGTFLRHHSSLPPRIVIVTKIFLLFLFHIDTPRLCILHLRVTHSVFF